MDDLAALMDPALVLPIRGREYRVECSAWHGLHLHRLMADPDRKLTDEEERAEIEATLGDAYRAMLDDGVPWAQLIHAGRTAMIHYGHSPTLAQLHWESAGGLGNVPPPPPTPAPTAWIAPPGPPVVGGRHRATTPLLGLTDLTMTAADLTTR